MLKAAFISGSGSSTDNHPMTLPHRAAPATCRATPHAGRRALLGAVLLAGMAGPVVWAGGRDDHERARAALQAGEVLPLATVLERLQQTHPGQVLELELERDHARWVYEIKLLQANGQLMKLRVDARSAQVLEARQKK